MDNLAEGKNVGQRVSDAIALAAAKGSDAYAWTSPRVAAAWRKGITAAAPKITEAAEALSPAVSKASTNLIDKVIPAVVEAVSNAAATAAVVGEKLSTLNAVAAVATRGDNSAKHSQQKEVATVSKKKHRCRKFFGFVTVAGILSAIGYFVWRQSQPLEDPWAEDEWDNIDAPDAPEASEETPAE